MPGEVQRAVLRPLAGLDAGLLEGPAEQLADDPRVIETYLGSQKAR